MRDVSEGHHALRERAELEARVLALQRTVEEQAARIRGLEAALAEARGALLALPAHDPRVCLCCCAALARIGGDE